MNAQASPESPPPSHLRTRPLSHLASDVSKDELSELPATELETVPTGPSSSRPDPVTTRTRGTTCCLAAAASAASVRHVRGEGRGGLRLPLTSSPLVLLPSWLVGVSLEPLELVETFRLMRMRLRAVVQAVEAPELVGRMPSAASIRVMRVRRLSLFF